MFKLVKLLLAFSWLVINIGAEHSQNIGKVVSVNKTVTGSKSGVLRNASNISANERIRSNASGLGHFKFTDGTKLVVGPGTNIVLDKLVYNPSGKSFKKFAIKSTSGAVRFISGSSRSSAYEIKTPVGTLGIRGTAFDIRHFRGRTYVMLVTGRVEFCSNSGECKTIRRKCDFVVADRNGQVSDPVQPKDSIFERRDVATFFPFIADQENIKPDFRQRVRSCGLSGGASSRGYLQRGIADGGDQDTGGNDTGGDDTGGDDAGEGENGGDDAGSDTGGDDAGSDADSDSAGG